jgi:hypothetical protein
VQVGRGLGWKFIQTQTISSSKGPSSSVPIVFGSPKCWFSRGYRVLQRRGHVELILIDKFGKEARSRRHRGSYATPQSANVASQYRHHLGFNHNKARDKPRSMNLTAKAPAEIGCCVSTSSNVFRRYSSPVPIQPLSSSSTSSQENPDNSFSKKSRTLWRQIGAFLCRSLFV